MGYPFIWIQNHLKGDDIMKLITEAEAAEYLGLPELLLKKFRCQDLICAYGAQPSDAHNPAARVWYDRDELDEYIRGDME